MKRRPLLNAGIVSMILMALGMPILWAQDLAQVAPLQAKVVMENDRVRVLKLVYEPGDKATTFPSSRCCDLSDPMQVTLPFD